MIRLATKVAGESKFRRARMGAVIEKSGRILSMGCNRIGYSKYLRHRPWPQSVHAEQQAILKLLRERRLDDLAGSTIYVSRVGANFMPRLARPCAVCRKLIKSVGIHKVVFTLDNGVGEYHVV